MFLKSTHIEPPQTTGFPFQIPAIRYAKHLDFSSPLTLIVGDNGSGKSTLIEGIAFLLQLPRLGRLLFQDRTIGGEPIFKLAENTKLDLDLTKKMSGFFFRAEDFGEFLKKDRDLTRYKEYEDSVDVFDSFREYFPPEIAQKLIENYSFRHFKQLYNSKLHKMSHGEAFLHIFEEHLNHAGLFILDEPEVALSPIRQLTLIGMIRKALKNGNCQFIIATHSPMLMAIPEATIYEVTEQGMKKTPLEEVEHFRTTKLFLNHTNTFFREFNKD